MNPLRTTQLYQDWTLADDARTPDVVRPVRKALRAILAFIDQSKPRGASREFTREERELTRTTAAMRHKLVSFIEAIPHGPSFEQTESYVGVLTSVVLCHDPRFQKTGMMAFFFALTDLTTYDPPTNTLPLLDLVYRDDARKHFDFPHFAGLTAARFFHEAQTEVLFHANNPLTGEVFEDRIHAIDYDQLAVFLADDPARHEAELTTDLDLYAPGFSGERPDRHTLDSREVRALASAGLETRHRITRGLTEGRIPALRH